MRTQRRKGFFAKHFAAGSSTTHRTLPGNLDGRWYKRILVRPRLRSYIEGLLLLACSAIVCIQVFVPPYIGFADNGDFAKINGRFSIGPTDPDSHFLYFNADYVLAPRFHWESEIHSTEQWFADAAFYLSRTRNAGDIFNIRWLGAVHAIVFLGLFELLLMALRPLSLWATALAGISAIWIFTDVLYVAYFNSFYTDAAALMGILGCTVFAALVILHGPRVWLLVAFTFFAIVLIGTKAQHAILALLPALFLILQAQRDPRGWIRAVSVGMGALVLAGWALVMEMHPREYQGQSLFALIFNKLTKISPAPAHDLEQLGLPADDLRYVGMWAFHPQSPAMNPQWLEDFRQRTSYSKLARFYVHEPSRAFQILRFDLRTYAPYIRFAFANFQRQDARQPQQMATRFASWSGLRTRIFFAWPGHILAWNALLGAAIVLILYARPSLVAVQMSWLTAGLILAAAMEFAVSSLADGAETFRHLFLFHAITDMTILLALIAVLSGTLQAAGEQTIAKLRFKG